MAQEVCKSAKQKEREVTVETMLGRKLRRHSPPEGPRTEDDYPHELEKQGRSQTGAVEDFGKMLSDIDRGAQKTGTLKEARQLTMPRKTGSRLPKWLRFGGD